MAKTYKGKSMKLGGGGRFAKMTDAIMKTGKSKETAQAIAASVGRKQLGTKKFNSLADKGKKRAK